MKVHGICPLDIRTSIRLYYYRRLDSLVTSVLIERWENLTVKTSKKEKRPLSASSTSNPPCGGRGKIPNTITSIYYSKLLPTRKAPLGAFLCVSRCAALLCRALCCLLRSCLLSCAAALCWALSCLLRGCLLNCATLSGTLSCLPFCCHKSVRCEVRC